MIATSPSQRRPSLGEGGLRLDGRGERVDLGAGSPRVVDRRPGRRLAVAKVVRRVPRLACLNGMSSGKASTPAKVSRIDSAGTARATRMARPATAPTTGRRMTPRRARSTTRGSAPGCAMGILPLLTRLAQQSKHGGKQGRVPRSARTTATIIAPEPRLTMMVDGTTSIPPKRDEHRAPENSTARLAVLPARVMASLTVRPWRVPRGSAGR